MRMKAMMKVRKRKQKMMMIADFSLFSFLYLMRERLRISYSVLSFFSRPYVTLSSVMGQKKQAIAKEVEKLQRRERR